MTNGKFYPLKQYLSHISASAVTLTFRQIEEIIGMTLCDAARKHTAYWHPAKGHTIWLAWEEAGWKLSHLDIRAEYVSFRRA